MELLKVVKADTDEGAVAKQKIDKAIKASKAAKKHKCSCGK